MQTAGHQHGNIVPITLALLVMLEVCGVRGCRTGTGSECEKAPLIPGHDLAGEGFDVVRMRRTGAYVINVNGHLDNNHTCTLCPNRFQQGQIQRLPAAVLDWRQRSHCSKQLSGAIHHSLESLLRASSLVNNNWDLGLSFGKSKAVLGGSGSNVAKFAQMHYSADKATFASHDISCTYYSYRVANHAQLSAEFTKAWNELPQSLNTSQDRDLYRQLIDTYGTHYIHKVQLGGKVKRTTAFRTCIATLNGVSDSEVKNCLHAELEIVLGFNVSLSKKCDNLLKTDMSAGFHHGFMTHETEVIGGESYFPDILHQRDPSEEFNSWMNSLHHNLDVVSYDIFPLHHLVEDPQISSNLRNAVTRYIEENQLMEDQFGFKKCSPTPNLDQNCCPLQAGRGTLRVEIERATDLDSDPWGATDAYVKIFYNSMYKQTETKMDTDYPTWYTTYDFGLADVSQELRLEVWDKDVYYDDLVGRCYVTPELGTHSQSCQLSDGVLFFTYTLKCDAHLTGFRCGRYSPHAE